MKIKNILAATAVTAWSGMACAGFVTTFGQTANGLATFPLTAYSEAAGARNAFVANPGTGAIVSYYDFESVVVDPITGVGPTTLSGIAFGAVTADLTGGVVKRAPQDGTDEGRYSVSGISGNSNQGRQYWEAIAPDGSASSFTINFSGAVQSFGFFGIDIGDFGGTLSLVLTRDNCAPPEVCEVTVSPGAGGPFGDPITDPTDADGSVLFFGVSATVAKDYFRSVRFITTGGGGDDVFAFDMFTVVAAPTGPMPTPLPGSLALVGAALGGLALVRRRR